MSLHLLYTAVQRRKRPEDVADAILTVLGSRLDRGERAMIEVAARGALRRTVAGYTSMLQDFARPLGLKRQADRASELFTGLPRLTDEDAADPVKVEAFICDACAQIQKGFGRQSFLYDRLNRATRAELGIGDSRRAYNRKFRLLVRMEKKLRRHARLVRQYELTRVGKSGLATWLSYDELTADLDTACFVAYYTARCNLRSEFTVSGQQRPFDTIAATLFERCQRSETTSYWAIAHVFPTSAVLARLTAEEKGRLLARWTDLLRELARLLEETWQRSRFARDTMIVRRGDDSTTWNQLARAWNTARDHWIAILTALGMEAIFDHLWPGKVMSLRAADVAAGHRAIGGGLHPDTRVWTALPAPWDVLEGRESCSRSLVEHTCRGCGVDPEKNGWTRPRTRDAVVAYRPTPELVHGVTIASPHVAAILKKAGYFSGKPKTEPASISTQKNVGSPARASSCARALSWRSSARQSARLLPEWTSVRPRPPGLRS